MSPQTYRPIKRDDRKLKAPTRSAARANALRRHEMTVVGSSAADVVASAGGRLYDRRMAGWHVNVLVFSGCRERALQILGAKSLDLGGDFDSILDDPDRAASLVLAADVYADDRVRRLVAVSHRGGGEVALWGDAESLGRDVSAFSYRLSAAGRAFKKQALLALGLPVDSVAPTEELFHCGVTTLAPATRVRS